MKLRKRFEEIIDLAIDKQEIIDFLRQLAKKGEKIEEIYELVMLLRERAIKIDSVDDAIDVCGTGGDGKNTYNISTAVAFVLASLDIPVVKHGNGAVSSKSGSSDVLQELGINIILEKEKVEKALADLKISFLFAPNYHPALKKIAPIRKEMGIRTIFNLVGPLLNPANPKKQFIGVYSRELLPLYAEICKKIGYEHAIIVSSFDGMDEISISDKSEIYEVKKGVITNVILDPKDYGFKKYKLSEISGGDAKFNADAMLSLFKGKKNAYYDIVLLNSAMASALGKNFISIEDSLIKIEYNLQNKIVLNKLEELKVFSNE